METAPASALPSVTVVVCVGSVASRTENVRAAFVAWPSTSASGPASAPLVDGSASSTTAGVWRSSTATSTPAMASAAT